MNEQREWVGEKWANIEVRYRVKEILFKIETDFQQMMLVDSLQYGKMLLLDGFVQTTEKDEFIYHEMMTHVPLFSHPEPRKALIIGGGDGGVLREVLRHKKIAAVTIVEIDPKVIDFCKRHLPSISNGAFDDRRAKVIIADGAQYIKETDHKYDIVIIDSPDPVGPAQILFSKQFYQDIYHIMRPGGIMVCQTGSTGLQPGEQRQAYRTLRDLFKYTAFYLYSVPTYIGGFFSSIFCSDDIEPKAIETSKLVEKFSSNKFQTQYYTPQIHSGAFHIPPFMEIIN